MNLFNLHTHSRFCDGKEEPEDYVRQAIELGYHTLGFSSHAPVPFENNFSLKDDKMEDYFSTIRALGEKYKSKINILLSMEIDFIPGITRDFTEFSKAGNLDYTIGGVHLVRNMEMDKLWFIDGSKQETYDDGLQKLFKGHIRNGVEAYYGQIMEMVVTQKPDIIAHIDKIKMHNKNRYFTEEESWYKDVVWKTLKLIAAESNCIIEVNTRGLYKKRTDTFFPGPAILEQIHHLKIPITLSADAHLPNELNGYYEEAMKLMKEIGFREIIYFNNKGRIKQSIN
jgi:histidinol-phosphatase (PHP family)